MLNRPTDLRKPKAIIAAGNDIRTIRFGNPVSHKYCYCTHRSTDSCRKTTNKYSRLWKKAIQQTIITLTGRHPRTRRLITGIQKTHSTSSGHHEILRTPALLTWAFTGRHVRSHHNLCTDLQCSRAFAHLSRLRYSLRIMIISTNCTHVQTVRVFSLRPSLRRAGHDRSGEH